MWKEECNREWGSTEAKSYTDQPVQYDYRYTLVWAVMCSWRAVDMCKRSLQFG